VIYQGEQQMPPIWESFGVLEDCAQALSSPPTLWQPVRPERTEFSTKEQVCRHQMEDIRWNRACPTCGVGLLGYEQTVCGYCQEEARDERT